MKSRFEDIVNIFAPMASIIKTFEKAEVEHRAEKEKQNKKEITWKN